MNERFSSRLSRGTPLILDGATGTELFRRGVDTGLPLWSANALLSESGNITLRQIHIDYLNAGADIITANTFRTHRRALRQSNHAERAFALTSQAVEVARAAIRSVELDLGRSAFLAGSISPLEDCYRPELVPADEELRVEHAERIRHLADCNVDVILIETMNTIREALICARLAVESGIPVVVSFVCMPNGKILSGESLTDASLQLLPEGISALGVNCGPAPALLGPLEELRAICGEDFPLIAYGNIGYADDVVGWVNTDAFDPDAYLAYAEKWPARIIGGCCGTTPSHIQRIKTHFNYSASPGVDHAH